MVKPKQKARKARKRLDDPERSKTSSTNGVERLSNDLLRQEEHDDSAKMEAIIEKHQTTTFTSESLDTQKCGECSGCIRSQDCGICENCLDQKCCLKRVCKAIQKTSKNLDIVEMHKSSIEHVNVSNFLNTDELDYLESLKNIAQMLVQRGNLDVFNDLQKVIEKAEESILESQENGNIKLETSDTEKCGICSGCVRVNDCGLCHGCLGFKNCLKKCCSNKALQQVPSTSASHCFSTSKSSVNTSNDIDTSMDEEDSESETEQFQDDGMSSEEESDFSESDGFEDFSGNETEDSNNVFFSNSMSDTSNSYQTRSKNGSSNNSNEDAVSRKRKSTDAYENEPDNGPLSSQTSQGYSTPNNGRKRPKIQPEKACAPSSSSMNSRGRKTLHFEPHGNGNDAETSDILENEKIICNNKLRPNEYLELPKIDEPWDMIDGKIHMGGYVFVKRDMERNKKFHRYLCNRCSVQMLRNHRKGVRSSNLPSYVYMLPNGELRARANFVHICEGIVIKKVINASIISNLPIIHGTLDGNGRVIFENHIYSGRYANAKNTSKKIKHYTCTDCNKVNNRYITREITPPCAIAKLYILENGEMRAKRNVEHLCEHEITRSNEHLWSSYDDSVYASHNRFNRLKNNEYLQLPKIDEQWNMVDGKILMGEHVFIQQEKDEGNKFKRYVCKLCYTESMRRYKRGDRQSAQTSYLYLLPNGELRARSTFVHICEDTVLNEPVTSYNISNLPVVNGTIDGNGKLIFENHIYDQVNKYREKKLNKTKHYYCMDCQRIRRECSFNQITPQGSISKIYVLENGEMRSKHNEQHLCEFEELCTYRLPRKLIRDENFVPFEDEYDQQLLNPDNDSELSVEQFLQELKTGTLYSELNEFLDDLEQRYPFRPNQNHEAYIAFTRNRGTVKEMIQSIKWFGRAENLYRRGKGHVSQPKGPLYEVYENEGQLFFAPLLLEKKNYDKCQNIEAILQSLNDIGKLFFHSNQIKNVRTEMIPNGDIREQVLNIGNLLDNEQEKLAKAMKQMIHASMRMSCNFIHYKKLNR